MTGNNILAALVEVARSLMNKMATKVAQNGLPHEITDSTAAGQPRKSGNGYSISVTIDLSENAAPMAAAFEWGSGIWGEKGERYKISPREGKEALAFEYEVGKNIPGEITESIAEPVRYSSRPEGKAIFMYVMHPGVQAKPYIRPSIEENRVEAKRLLGRAFVESLGLRGKTVYTIKVM